MRIQISKDPSEFDKPSTNSYYVTNNNEKVMCLLENTTDSNNKYFINITKIWCNDNIKECYINDNIFTIYLDINTTIINFNEIKDEKIFIIFG